MLALGPLPARPSLMITGPVTGPGVVVHADSLASPHLGSRASRRRRFTPVG
jgi:hypothetical protein